MYPLYIPLPYGLHSLITLPRWTPLSSTACSWITTVAWAGLTWLAYDILISLGWKPTIASNMSSTVHGFMPRCIPEQRTWASGLAQRTCFAVPILLGLVVQGDLLRQCYVVPYFLGGDYSIPPGAILSYKVYIYFLLFGFSLSWVLNTMLSCAL